MAFRFAPQLRVGRVGERVFLTIYGQTYVAQNGTHVRNPDARHRLTNHMVEIKTDVHQPRNVFMERYSDVEKQTLGGPWRARAEGVSFFAYMFISPTRMHNDADVDSWVDELAETIHNSNHNSSSSNSANGPLELRHSAQIHGIPLILLYDTKRLCSLLDTLSAAAGQDGSSIRYHSIVNRNGQRGYTTGGYTLPIDMLRAAEVCEQRFLLGIPLSDEPPDFDESDMLDIEDHMRENEPPPPPLSSPPSITST